jgi:hypothetical protein
MLLEEVTTLVKLVILRNIRDPDYESIVNKMANGFRTEGMYLGTRKFAFHVGEKKYVVILTEVEKGTGELVTEVDTSLESGEEGELVIRVFYESGSALSSIGREIERIRVEDNCDGPIGKVARFIERKQGLKEFTLNSAVMVCYYGGAFCTNCILGECKVNKSSKKSSEICTACSSKLGFHTDSLTRTEEATSTSNSQRDCSDIYTLSIGDKRTLCLRIASDNEDFDYKPSNSRLYDDGIGENIELSHGSIFKLAKEDELYDDKGNKTFIKHGVIGEIGENDIR